MSTHIIISSLIAYLLGLFITQLYNSLSAIGSDLTSKDKLDRSLEFVDSLYKFFTTTVVGPTRDTSGSCNLISNGNTTLFIRDHSRLPKLCECLIVSLTN